MASSKLELNGDALRLLLSGGSAFVNAPDLLNDLSNQQATAKPATLPHSIATLTAHMHYWQSWFYDNVCGTPRDYPTTNTVTFPAVSTDAWPTVRHDFLTRLETIGTLCDDSELLNRRFSNERVSSEKSIAMVLLYTVALHNAHHLGQIITLRQLAGDWPPAAGGVVF